DLGKERDSGKGFREGIRGRDSEKKFREEIQGRDLGKGFREGKERHFREGIQGRDSWKGFREGKNPRSGVIPALSQLPDSQPSRRLEKLEADARHGTEKLEEINSKWALVGDVKIPQELWEVLEQQREECEQLLAGKNRLIRELQEVFWEFSELLPGLEGGATQVLLERMEEQTRNMLRSYRHHLRRIEKTFEEERREMLASNRERWNEAMRAHNEQEYLERKLRSDEGVVPVGFFPCDFHGIPMEFFVNFSPPTMEFQHLERKLRQMKGIYHLNQVKLEYNLDVLRQLDVENSTLRSLQKRKINRFRTTLELLKDKMAKQEAKFQEEKQSLESELERVVGQFQETRDRMRFRQVWIVNEEEAKALIREVLDADRIIHVQQLGMPWEEPPLWFMDNVGPLGRSQEKRDAIELPLPRLSHPRIFRGYPTSTPSHHSLLIRNFPRIPAFPLLLENSHSPSPSHGTLTEFPLFQAFRIEDEDELRALVDFFLDYESHHDLLPIPNICSPSQSFVLHPKDLFPFQDFDLHPEDLFSIPKFCFPSQGFVPYSQGFAPHPKYLFSIPRIPSPSQVFPLRPKALDLHPKALFSIPRDEGPPKEIQDVRDNSKDGEYWEAMTRIIPQRKLKLWDALGAALSEYHKVLTRRSELLSEAMALQRQNSELGMLLEEYLGSTEFPELWEVPPNHGIWGLEFSNSGMEV
uniref:Dynein regulatory complex protein 1 n=1 Tax=Geospiza parvula TaxID=87175 RepID=A0A8C3NBV3_GEOPR